MRLEGKVALITGGATGIGRGSALLFAKHGAKIAVADYNAEEGQRTVEIIRENGGQAIFILTDVAKAGECERAVSETVKTFGALHILYNNAGIWRRGTVVDMSEDEWDRTISVNLKSMFLMSKFAIPEIVKSGGGSIVNMASASGHGGCTNASAYGVAKAGVISLTKSMAADYGPQGIRVNSLSPGRIETPLIHGLWESEGVGYDEGRRRDMASEVRPLRTIGFPEDVAYAALYLASHESRYVTGADILIDGGANAETR
jgi:NAD(P)-dependent dehydrogenase (short-subunit alcohol dehydrogenase family)